MKKCGGWLGGGTAPLRSTHQGGTVPLCSTHQGGTVPLRSTHQGGTVPLCSKHRNIQYDFLGVFGDLLRLLCRKVWWKISLLPGLSMRDPSLNPPST